jgi:GAF domain-containing protein
MIDWLRKIVASDFDDEEMNQKAFNLNAILLVSFAGMSVNIIAVILQVGKLAPPYIASTISFLVITLLVISFCYYFSRRGRVQLGSIIFIVWMTISTLAIIVIGDTQGLVPYILLVPLATAGVTLGGSTSLVFSLLIVGITLTISILKQGGITSALPLESGPNKLLVYIDAGFGFTFLILSFWLATHSLRQSLDRTRKAAKDTEQFRLEAEEHLAAEQIMRDRLQWAIDKYTIFLERIERGNYAVRLALTEDDESLALLEQKLNSTVDMLVTALEASESAREEAEATYRRYLRQAWREYLRETPDDFEITNPNNTFSRDSLIPIMEKALQQRRSISSTHSEQQNDATADLAIPITLRGETIGLLGIQRDIQEQSWSPSERALVEAIADRLALTIDRLRLMHETQNRAAREQLIGEISSRIRETLDIDTVLKTAVQEIGEKLALSRAEVRITTSDKN